MKRKLLFAILMIASVLGLRAQTDVTESYLQNTDFSSTSNWAQVHSSQYWSLGNGLIGTYAVANNKTSTTDATHLSSEYCLGLQCRWQTNYANFTQTTATLPVGVYTLTYDVQNTNASTSATYENRFTVTVGGTTYTDASTEWMRGSTGWTTHTITFSVTEATTATISFGYGTGSNNYGSGSTPHLYVSHLKLTWTDPLQAAKEALQAEIEKASLCDAKEGLASAIAAAEDALANATTQAELEQALATLQAADKDPILRYENGLTDASATNGMTTSFVVNGTFTDNVNGWTCTGGFQNQNRASNQQGDFTVPFFENWNPNAKANKMYQTINNVPNGTYKLKIAAFVNTLDGTTQYVFANDDKTYLTTTSPTFYEVWTVVTNNTIEIGLEQTTATANWMGIDNVSLTYYGAGDVRNAAQAGAHKTNWDEAVANAQAALASSDYANVTGAERTALQTELAKGEPSSAQGYDDATAALNAATNAFTAAKVSYDLFAEYNKDLAYALASKKPSVSATSTAASVITALRAYYESHAMAEGVSGAVNMTSAITNATEPTNNDGWTWTGNKNNPASNEPWTDADGTNAHSYFDGGNWGANSWTTTMEQTVTIPAGRYLLTAKARAATNVTFTMEAGGQSVALPHISSVGNVFDRGWGDASVEFESLGEDVTIKVTASSSTIHEWFSISDFRLMQLEAISVILADAADYQALAAAISTAETKTLGFQAGEYAPYNNVAALQALAAAKAIDPEAANGNTKEKVQNATSALTAATWTSNSTDVDAIYNGMFATVTESANYPEGWARTNAWGQMQSGIEGDFATAYYNQPGSLVHGTTGVYTMPLAANQSYKLTFSYRSHEANSNNGMTVNVKSNGNTVVAPTYNGNGSTTDWVTEYAYFTTTDAADYVIELANGGNTWMTNVSLVKIEKNDDLNGDGKVDETDQEIAEQIAQAKYTIGDVNEDDNVSIADVTALVNIVLGKTTDYQVKVADVNEDNSVSIADVTALVNIVLGKAEAKTVDESWKLANLEATVYAEQKATENANGANYGLTSATAILDGSDVSDKLKLEDYLTTLKVTVSISNAQSVSIYAKGKENIAGLMSYSTLTKAATYSAGETPSAYVNNEVRNDVNGTNMQSDVVTVTGDAGTYVAYLLPVSLSNGVTVTVRDNNGKFYSQDFTDLTIGGVNNLTFTETTATNNWMATIPGNVNFSMLSTPGAHNAATSSCGSLAKCQSETIEGLLNNGVRAFDLRPGYKYSSTITTENLYIYHGMYNTNVLYKDAITAMVTFLQAHPTEAISVIMAKEDGTPLLSNWTDYTNEMCSAIDAIHTQYTDYIKMLDHSYYTLDEFRGKIFFGYRNAWDLHKTVRVTNWPDASSVTDYSVTVGGLCKASVEDAYNTSGDSKKAVVNALLDLASANTDRARFHYTFTSVANSITSSANTQNPAAATYIGTLTGPTGYVFADFMGSSSYSGQTLLKAVIDQNYKYVFKGRSRVN
ncbi:MAG: hypothetical protein IJ762_00055 [Bacteroidaceae bacterium]|nr:hypothetical protein [Bacteroidaceae bacterium]